MELQLRGQLSGGKHAYPAVSGLQGNAGRFQRPSSTANGISPLIFLAVTNIRLLTTQLEYFCTSLQLLFINRPQLRLFFVVFRFFARQNSAKPQMPRAGRRPTLLDYFKSR